MTSEKLLYKMGWQGRIPDDGSDDCWYEAWVALTDHRILFVRQYTDYIVVSTVIDDSEAQWLYDGAGVINAIRRVAQCDTGDYFGEGFGGWPLGEVAMALPQRTLEALITSEEKTPYADSEKDSNDDCKDCSHDAKETVL